MAAVLHPPAVHTSSSGILINNPLIPPSPLSVPQFISNSPSLSSSSSSDDGLSSNSYQSVSQSTTGARGASTRTRPGTRSSSIPSSVRRIRFAPLPDPRALDPDDSLIGVIPGVDGDFISAKLDASSNSTDLLTSASPSPHPPLDVSRSPSSSTSCFSGSTLHPNASPPPCGDISLNTSTSTLPDSITPTGASPTSSKKGGPSWTSKPKSLFKPFLRRSSSPMAPASSGFNISTEDILTLGAINLFKTSSRESRSGASVSSEEGGHGNGLGLSLDRWTSAKSYNGQKNNGKEWFGSPLARTESTQSYKGDLRSHNRASTAPAPTARPATSPSSTQSPKPKPKSKSAPPLSTQVPLKNRRKGTRMLNGRVYGARRIDAQNTNMFVTAKDEEPEFVEWGYGGMGSVKAGKRDGGTQWSRLQSGESEDPDDGGGMEWVRKRKEKREKEKKEREEREREKEKGSREVVDAVENQPSDPPPPPVVEEQPSSKDEVTQDEAAPSPALVEQQPQPLPSMLLSPPDETTPPQPLPLPTPPISADADHHPSSTATTTTVTVTVPAPSPAPVRCHSHRTASHAGSVNTNTNTSHSQVNLDSEGEKEREIVMSPRRMSFEGAMELGMERLVSAGGEDEKAEEERVSESGSESDSEREEDLDDDEPEDEDEDERIRKTALGAGVEKISRHKEDS